jgi:hypothetical protein
MTEFFRRTVLRFFTEKTYLPSSLPKIYSPGDTRTSVRMHGRVFPRQKVPGKVFIQQFAFYQQLNHPTAEYLDHGLEPGEWDVEEDTLLVKSALENDRVEMRVEPQLIAEFLVGDNHPGKQRSARGLVVELTEDVVDQTRHLGEGPKVVMSALRVGTADPRYTL